MKLAVVGATGWIGSALVAEALARGHAVTAVVRDPAKLPPGSPVEAMIADVEDVDALAAAFRGQDAVLHAFAPPRTASDEERIARQAAGTRAIIAAAHRAGVSRLIAVGGA
ncbi:MAG: NAD(P)H-binding protein, partial [Caulobacteraceae bacterium]|nr:NAD(P)H-binding protein [Caulobacter sp.]